MFLLLGSLVLVTANASLPPKETCMTVKRLIAIIFIFICTFIAWMILGAVNSSRTGDTYSALYQDVRSLYGDALKISAPTVNHEEMVPYVESVNGVRGPRYHKKTTPIEIAKQDVDIQLQLDSRKKGTLWFPTFKATFSAEYIFDVPANLQQETVKLYAPLGSSNSIYTDIEININGNRQTEIAPLLKNLPIELDAPGKQIVLSVSYRTTGMGEMNYVVTPGQNEVSQIRNLNLHVKTDFDDYDFVADTLSPTKKTRTQSGYDLAWKLKNAVTGKDIGVSIPSKLNPGDILTRVTFFAPVPLLFFFFVVMVISIIKKIPIHPMHYFFLATSFFSFHLMFSYYSDHMNIYLAFAVASVVSLVLTATYLRLFTPNVFAFVIAPVAQLIYLIIFSFSFFFKGTSGMIGTTFAVLTLFALMQLTGKLNWEDVFGPRNKALHETPRT